MDCKSNVLVEKMKKSRLKFVNLEIIGVDTICTWKSNAKMNITEVGVKLWSGFIWLEGRFQERKSLVSQKYPN